MSEWLEPVHSLTAMDNDETTKRPTSPTTPEEQLDRGKKPASPLSTVAEAEKQEGSKGKGLAFWLVFVSLCVTSLLSALELVCLSMESRDCLKT
jgi:hypothetical protein